MGDPPSEVVDSYIQRKKAKGTWGQPKLHRWKLPDEKQRRRHVRTGICPCPECGHKGDPMIVCDADWNDCHCCNEVCS